MDLEALDSIGQQVSLRLSEDRMEAILFLAPGHRPTEVEIDDLLRHHGVTEGIDSEYIMRLAQDPRSGHHVVARGLPPGDTQDSEIVLTFNPDPVPQPRIDDGGRAHYFDLGGIPCCDEGQVLARKQPGTQGAPGRTVQGDPIEARVPRDPQLLAGVNTRLVEDEEGVYVVAERGGQPLRRGSLIMVRDLYVVAGDLDVAVGNIEHNGAVLVRGKICEQLVLRAKGDVTIEGNVETATVVCGGDLTILGGILRESKVSVGGSLRTRFIERSHVEVDQHLFVQEDVMFSEVEAGGVMEVQSGVVGGKATIAGYLRAAYLGKRLGTPTQIEVGAVAKWNERLKQAEAKLAEAQEQLVSAMQPLQELLLLDADGALDENGLATKAKLERSVEQARAAIADRLKNMLRFKSLIQSLPLPKVLTPGGVIHPGVQIQIKAANFRAETTTRATEIGEHRGEIEIF